jgi:hypothetical protein
MVDDQHDQQVWLWDTGPRKPKMPDKPIPPKQDGMSEGEYDLAMIEFRVILEDYETELKAYGRARIEFQEWHKRNGGPVEFPQFSCDADDTLDREPNRYYVSSRTRGHENDANLGLPPGMKPGHGQAELERRRREGDEMLKEVRRQDPIFGDPNLRAG